MTGLWISILIFLVISVAIVGGIAYLVNDLDLNKAWVFVAAFVCFLAFGAFTWWNWATVYKNDHWAVCHVTGKDRGGDNGSYRVYTSDCGQLANEDSVLRKKFDSADIWEDIPSHGAVRLRIAGSRVPVFSQFPNIFDAEKAVAQQ